MPLVVVTFLFSKRQGKQSSEKQQKFNQQISKLIAQLNGIGKKENNKAGISTSKNVPVSGQLRFHLCEWQNLTSDATIVQKVAILNLSLHLVSYLCQKNFSLSETCIVGTLIQELLEKGVILESIHEKDEFTSPIFICPKKNVKYKFILKLKNQNTYVN